MISVPASSISGTVGLLPPLLAVEVVGVVVGAKRDFTDHVGVARRVERSSSSSSLLGGGGGGGGFWAVEEERGRGFVGGWGLRAVAMGRFLRRCLRSMVKVSWTKGLILVLSAILL